ncbi:DUF935 family protein [Budviciaceae bacterium BWR-B9]|uniref:DUF935 family protein n=1 Tax=Limnobaculum allomyrinae TaxID=2791986 RepID=A0ABS1IWJ0_9GAMM|nr:MULTISPECIES: DUF935 family protein [Limnobaculum]MBK5145947.1 DUF935 family protein [Limnobaculum allomyrinae]MBV7693998.1 DUF935 domain-containing protein [Limnobaculum sp. M2-1]
MSKGIWVSPNEFVSFAELKRPSKEVIATRSRVNGSLGITGALPNPDPVLRKMGKSIQVYRDLTADAHVGGCVRRRKSAVLALEYGFDRESASAPVSDFIDKVFAKLRMRTLISEALDAPLYGYTPLEVMWEDIDDRIVPVQVVAKPAEWFFFDDENRLRMRTKDNKDGILLPERKFILVRQDATYENPYGIADLSRCFWPTTFKRGGFEFWLKFTEKYGSPFLVGKHPRNTHNSEVDALLDSLEAMVQDAVAAIPDDSSIEILEAAGKGSSADIYERLMMFCRSEVSIALTGTNQTTEADTTNAIAQAGLTVSEDIRDADAELVSEAMNTLARWTVELNFSEDENVPVWSMWSPETIDKTLAERDQILKTAGANFTNAYFMREYNLKEGDLGEQLPPSAGMGYPSFAENPQKHDPIKAAADQLSRETQPIVDGWLERIRYFAEKSKSMEELQERLLEEFDNLPEEELAQAMASAFTAINLQGRDEVNHGH